MNQERNSNSCKVLCNILLHADVNGKIIPFDFPQSIPFTKYFKDAVNRITKHCLPTKNILLNHTTTS